MEICPEFGLPQSAVDPAPAGQPNVPRRPSPNPSLWSERMIPSGFQALMEHLTAREWPFERDNDRFILRMGFEGTHAKYRCVAIISDEDDLCQFYTMLPTKVPPEKRPAVAEVCIRASHGLPIGGFELDMDDGEVRLHCSAPYPSGGLDDSVIIYLVSACVRILDNYHPAFMSVLYAGGSPKDAVLAVEQQIADSDND